MIQLPLNFAPDVEEMEEMAKMRKDAAWRGCVFSPLAFAAFRPVLLSALDGARVFLFGWLRLLFQLFQDGVNAVLGEHVFIPSTFDRALRRGKSMPPPEDEGWKIYLHADRLFL